MNSAYFKNEAKKDLQGKWQTFSMAVIFNCVIFLFVFIRSVTSIIFLLANDLELFEIPLFFNGLSEFFSNDIVSILFDVVSFFIASPLVYAMSVMALKVANNKEIEFNNIYDGFRNYKSVIVLCFVENIYIMLWTLLFIIPGIVKGISYSMSYFIMAEHPDMTATEILKESERLMQGHKWEYCMLMLDFSGWILLSVVTLDLSSIYSSPYLYTAQAEFYQYIKHYKNSRADFADSVEGQAAAE